jgi:hypothetical protein
MDAIIITWCVVAMLLNTIMLYQVVSQIPTWKRAAVVLWFNTIVAYVMLVVVAGRIS